MTRLPPEQLAKVKSIVLLGPESSADFEFHLSDWLGLPSEHSRPVLPEVQKIKGKQVLCFYGEEEKDSICPKLEEGSVEKIEMRGGHHFEGNYKAIAEAILKATQ